MIKETFEDYLKAVHAEFYTGTDDDMSDSYESWLADLGTDEYIQYANEAIQRAKEGMALNMIPF